MNSEILEIAHHLEAQVQKIFSLLENMERNLESKVNERELESKKRNLESEVDDIEREFESEHKKQKRDAFFFSPPSDEIFSFDSSFDSSFSHSEDSEGVY